MDTGFQAHNYPDPDTMASQSNNWLILTPKDDTVMSGQSYHKAYLLMLIPLHDREATIVFTLWICVCVMEILSWELTQQLSALAGVYVSVYGQIVFMWLQ